jgi:hypothetical protein
MNKRPARSGKTVALSVMTRLQNLEQRANTFDLRMTYRAAYLLVHHAFFGSQPDPYAAAIAQVQQIDRNYGVPRRFPSADLPFTEEIRITLREVDGRTGDQWVQSVKAYLHWRSGRDWRNSSAYKSAECETYVTAILTMNLAFNDMLPARAKPPAKVFAMPTPAALKRAA